MLDFFLCLPGTLAPSDAPPLRLDELDRTLVEAIGVTFEKAATACTSADGTHTRPSRFDSAGGATRVFGSNSEAELSGANGLAIGAIETRCPSGSARWSFAPLAELGERAPSLGPCSTCAWSPDGAVTPRTLAFTAPRVRWSPDVFPVVQTSTTGIATGSVELWTSRDPMDVVALRSGCGMTHAPAAPFAIGPAHTTLRPTIDLHDLPQATNLCLSVVLSDGSRVGVPFTLDVERALLELSGGGEFASDPRHPCTLAITARERAISSVTIAARPPCVSIASWTESSARVTLDVVTAELARRRHVCGAVRGVVAVAGDPRPFAFAFVPHHDAGVDDEAGRSIAHGMFIPGETVLFARAADGTLRRAHPQRMAAVSDLWDLDSSNALATWTVPTNANGPVDAVVRARDGEELRVLGFASNELGQLVEAWTQMGR